MRLLSVLCYAGYRSWSYFENAVNRVFKNALTYNEPGSAIANDAKRLQELFNDYAAKSVPLEVKAKPSELLGVTSTIGSDPAAAAAAAAAAAGGGGGGGADGGAEAIPKNNGGRMTRKQGIIATLNHLATLEKPGRGYKLIEVFTELPDKEEFATYYEIIKHPICLSQMWQKAQSGQYTRWATFENELLRLVQNAHAYNEPDSDIHADATTLEKAYRDYVAKSVPAEITAPTKYEVERRQHSGAGAGAAAASGEDGGAGDDGATQGAEPSNGGSGGETGSKKRKQAPA